MVRLASSLSVVMVTVVAICIVGCGSQSETQKLPERPLRKMKSLLKRGLYEQAWQLSPEVLKLHGDDADVIASIAQLAYEIKKPDQTAKLLAQACEAEAYANPSRVQQAMIAFVGVGRLHDAMQLLETAVQRNPDQQGTRRLLFDLTMGTEERLRGLNHGRVLVRQRQFDLELLTTLSNTERRTLEAAPLETMTSRNADDLRPLVGSAKTKFDEGDYQAAIDELKKITERHPDYVPAQSLLGRSYAASNRFAELERWAASQPPGTEAAPGYWIALGDWARGKGMIQPAMRAYWEAARRDPDAMESWSKLSTSIAQLRDEDSTAASSISDDVFDAIQRRNTLLSKFNQLKNRFERTGNISREIAADIIRILVDLGRLWEAEAWASVAMSLPENDDIPLAELRGSVIRQLTNETPWQIATNRPELQLDLTRFRLPSIARINSDRNADVAKSNGSSSQMPGSQASGDGDLINRAWRLEDEASARGLDFFGRTSDHLDQAGIMLHETLGCGGGTIDFDLDGWSDLYLMAAGGKPGQLDSAANALIRNYSGQFGEVTRQSQTGHRGFGQGVAVGDINEDGFPDLLLLNYGPNALLINNGDGSFSDRTDRWNLNFDADTQITWSTSGAIADVDGDGLSDVVVVNYCAGLEPSIETCPMADSESFRSCSPVKFPGHVDWILKTRGDGTFVNQTEAWSMAPDVVGRGLGVVVGQLDSTTGIDVLITNDMTNNHYWSCSKTNSDKSSEAMTELLMIESAMVRGVGADDRSLAQGSMGIATGDFDLDGDADFYVTNFDNEYNILHEQRSNGMWQDQTSSRGLVKPTMPLVGFGTEAINLDNDGNLELVVSNGHVDLFSRGEDRALYAQPMQIFQRLESGLFAATETSVAGNYLRNSHVGRALWTIDADRDGRMDLAVTHQTEPVSLLINRCEPAGHWIDIRLSGRTCGRDAIGATVTVAFGGQTRTTFQSAGDGYMCSNQRGLHVGLGLAEPESGPVCDVTIQWPDGSRQVHPGLAVDASYSVTEMDETAFQLP
ncbi:FG-GAP-like repeat-containing protein [Rubripirellula reticaptiva]|uniref:Tetratricopeptide repeat protein n=1 Tax=Rubripirellula reticaptiva TaxID=2528013 RepID=A0A5C6EL07_9BACT|nr:FG-GAP-like repeat-containing protein [Rubripirellula reticaptiva]TWU49135.1 tetratricopeptide repeat protein [Rubripirellula reticaptiva]